MEEGARVGLGRDGQGAAADDDAEEEYDGEQGLQDVGTHGKSFLVVAGTRRDGVPDAPDTTAPDSRLSTTPGCLAGVGQGSVYACGDSCSRSTWAFHSRLDACQPSSSAPRRQ